jgi:hypothetical protein
MKFKNQTSTFIYEDKVAIFLWTENPLAILIRNKEFSNSNRNYFEYLWTNSENWLPPQNTSNSANTGIGTASATANFRIEKTGEVIIGI